MSEIPGGTSKKVTAKTVTIAVDEQDTPVVTTVETTSTESSTCGPTKSMSTPPVVPFLTHVKKGAAELMVQHLHGLTMSLTSFLEQRERTPEAARGGRETIKRINEAHRKYKLHTHDAGNEFLDHVLKFRTTTAK